MNLSLVQTACSLAACWLAVADWFGTALIGLLLKMAARGKAIIRQASSTTAVVTSLSVNTRAVVVAAIYPFLVLTVDTAIVETTDSLSGDEVVL